MGNLSIKKNPKVFVSILLRSRTATGMDGTLPHSTFGNLKPVKI